MSKETTESLHDTTIKYLKSVKFILLEEQAKLDNCDENDNLISSALRHVIGEGALTHLISKPFQVGANFIRIGVCEGTMKLYTAEDRPVHVPFAADEEEITFEVIAGLVEKPEDLAGLQEFYLDIFNGIDKNKIREKF